MNIGVIGAGVFGIASAIELRERGHTVTVFDQGAVPYPDASSTDVSKGIRRTWYAGDNETYVELVERAATRWRAWEERFETRLYHQVGGLSVLGSLEPGEPMHASVEFLQARGAGIEVLSASEARTRFPQIRVADHEVCVYDRWAGYIESGRAVSLMARMARDGGVEVREYARVDSLKERPSHVEVVSSGEPATFDRVVVAAGSLGRPTFARDRRPRQDNPPGDASHRTAQSGQIRPRGDALLGRGPRRRGLVWLPNPKGRVRKGLQGATGRHGRPGRGPVGNSGVRRGDHGLSQGAHSGDGRGQDRGRPLMSVHRHSRRPLHRRLGPGRTRVLVAGGGSGHGFKVGASIGPVIADALEDRHNSLGVRFRIGDRFEHKADRAQQASRGFARPPK